MAETPPLDDDEEPTDPQSLFLISLWDKLDRAEAASVNADVLDHLDEIQTLCEEAAAIIRQWRAQNP